MEAAKLEEIVQKAAYLGLEGRLETYRQEVEEEAGEGEGGLEVQEVGKEVAKVVAEVPKGRLEVLEERVERPR